MEAMKAIAAKAAMAAMAAIDKKLATFEKSHPKVLQCSWGSGCRRHFEGDFSNSPIFCQSLNGVNSGSGSAIKEVNKKKIIRI